jgi:WD40 repeat protein
MQPNQQIPDQPGRTCGKCGVAIDRPGLRNLCPSCLIDTALDIEDHTSASRGGEEPTSDIFGEYLLLGRLGAGGQGWVFRARHLRLGRMVALKTIPPAHLASAHAAERFRVEATAASGLDHPHIVPLYEVGERDGFAFLSMKLIEGTTLEEWSARTRPDLASCRDAAGMLSKVADAVHHAHQRGVLHRDLKPSNILLDAKQEPYVSDFGSAIQFDKDSGLTQTRTIVGTPAFLAPEVARAGSRHSTVGADIYGLGAILYYVLTGRPPFATSSLVETLRALQEDAPLPPKAFNSVIPKDLETICLRCLEKDPSRRYATAQELSDDLSRFLRHEPIMARPIGPLAKSWRWARRKPVVAGLLAALSLALFLGVAGVFWQWRRAQAGERAARRSQYVADMNMIQKEWDAGNLAGAQRLLAGYRHQPGSTDLRGFEWRYLWRLCRDESQFQFTNLPGPVRSLALYPDGRTLAVASTNTIQFVNVTQNRYLGFLASTNGTITALAISTRQTQLLAAAESAGLIEVWDAISKRSVARFVSRSSGISSLAFSPDGKYLASAGFDNTLDLWNLALRTNAWHRTTFTGVPVQTLAFASDSTVLVSGGGEMGNALVWDLKTGGSLQPFPQVHTAWTWTIAFSPDGRTMATSGNDSRVVLWDFSKHRQIGPSLEMKNPVSTVTFFNDGRRVAAACADGAIRICDIQHPEHIEPLRGHLKAALSLALANNGQVLVSGGADGIVRTWNLEQRPQEAILKGHWGWVSELAFSADGQFLAIADYHANAIKIWDVKKRQFGQDFPGHTNFTFSMSFSPDGKLFATGGSDLKVRLWDLSNRTCRILTNAFQNCGVSFSPDSRFLAVVHPPTDDPRTNDQFALWNISTGKRLDSLAAAKSNATAFAFANDGRTAAVGYRDGSVRLWNIRSGELLTEFREHTAPVICLVFSKNGKWLASSGEDPFIGVYDLPRGVALPHLQGHSASIWSLAFHPDGRSLASASHDGTIKLWNLPTPEAALTLQGHVGPVPAIAFSPDGNVLASGGADGDVRLWEASPLSE